MIDNDAISRQEALDEWNRLSERGRTEFDQVLMMLPSAQPEPCEDAVSRKAAIDALRMDISIIPFAKAREYVRAAIETIYNRLEELPSAQPERRWIPVSERLPEPRIDVWCNSDMGQMVGYYEENVETWYGRDYLELMVTAWMPLPEPYRDAQ